MKKIILASSNQNKIKEVQSYFKDQFMIVGQNEYNIESVEEDRTTFVENALKKAKAASEYSNLPAIADDSGLIIPSLNNEPGLFSARYAGENSTNIKNMQKVLSDKRLKIDRKAYFYCVLVFIKNLDDPAPIIATGKLYGEITNNINGQGFGYDPIFYNCKIKDTLNKVSIDMKNTISHRGIALKKLAKQLEEIYGTTTT